MPRSRPSELASDLARVREALVRELDTVSWYEEAAQVAASPEAKAFFAASAADEKRHIAQLTRLLRSLDPDLEVSFRGTGKGDPGVPPAELTRLPEDPARILHALPAAPSPHAAPFTVGSLRGTSG